MRNLLEFDTVQNNALGALVLWQFVSKYYKENNRKHGPIILLLMPVLPMIFHEETMLSICNRNYIGGLYRSILENPTIPVGLQERMEAMSGKTFKSLKLAIAADLLDYNSDFAIVYPLRMTKPFKLKSEETKNIIFAAKRLGYWFSNMTLEEICILLKVRF